MNLLDSIAAKYGSELVESNGLAQQLYAALCNNVLCKQRSNASYTTSSRENTAVIRYPGRTIAIDVDNYFSCTWRGAAAYVAEIRNGADEDLNEDYLDWYCSGISDLGTSGEYGCLKRFITTPEGDVTEAVARIFNEFGYRVCDASEADAYYSAYREAMCEYFDDLEA
jgi:hypothetical protein